MRVADHFNAPAVIRREMVSTTALHVTSASAPLMATPAAVAAGVAASGVLAAAFAGGFSIGHAIG